jgi:hypothetical protein
LICQDDVHPKITALIQEYIRHFRSVQFRLLCKEANVNEKDLLTDSHLVKDGKNMICYSYILGKCNGKYYGQSAEGHVAATRLAPELVDRLCDLLRPGVERRFTTEPAVQAIDYFPSNKRHHTS